MKRRLLARYREQLEWHKSEEALNAMPERAAFIRRRHDFKLTRMKILQRLSPEQQQRARNQILVECYYSVIEEVLANDEEARLHRLNGIKSWKLPVHGPFRKAFEDPCHYHIDENLDEATTYITSNEEMRRRQTLLIQYRKLDDLEHWLSSFPQGALDFIQRHRFKERRWHLINLWIRVPGARDLFEDIPALAVALSSAWCFRENPPHNFYRTIRNLAKRRRTHILEWLGFPPSKAVLCLLKRLSPGMLTVRQLLRLRELITVRSQILPRMLDLRGPINPRIIYTLRSSALPSPPLLRLITSKVPQSDQALNMFTDACAMIAGLDPSEKRSFSKSLERVNSLAGLHKIHQEITTLSWDRMHAEARQNLAHQPASGITAPLPGTDSILPLETTEQVIEEGRQMNNCLHSYVDRISKGTYFAYSVQWQGNRATLGLKAVTVLQNYYETGSSVRWVIDQLEAPNNQPAAPAIKKHVEEWFMSHQEVDATAPMKRAG